MSLTWVIAGGGTGGHFFSGVAISEAARLRDPGCEVVFVGTEAGIEGRIKEREQLDIRYISVSGLKGKSLPTRLWSMARLPVALAQSMNILGRAKPDVVVGVGGYASGPLLLAAWMMGIPSAVMEQNSVPGYTNSVLARFVDRVFVGFPGTEEHFPGGKAVYTGNPIRPAVAERLTRSRDEEKGDGIHLLVFGGSQGAHHINTAMPDAVKQLDPALLERMTVLHQTGEADLEDVRRAYDEGGHADRIEVVPFIEDMASAYARADLVVCRAGAMTVAEITVCRLPSILVPFPYAIYNHQELNARSLSDRGAARLLLDGDMDGRRLASEIEGLAGDPEALERMAAAAAEIGRPAAGDDVAAQCEALAERRNG